MMDITPPFWQARPSQKGINQRRNAGELYAGSSWSPAVQKAFFWNHSRAILLQGLKDLEKRVDLSKGRCRPIDLFWSYWPTSAQ